MAIKLASLFIAIGARSGELTRELSRTRQQTSTWSGDIAKITKRAAGSFLAVSAAATGVALVLGSSFRTRSEYLDTLGKTAAKLGETTENLRELRLAAGFAGVAEASLDISLQRMVRRLSEAAAGGGEAKGAIEELGLDAAKLAKANPAAAFEAIVAALEDVEDQNDRVRLAFKFFDSDGVALVNVTRGVLQQAAGDIAALGGAITSLDISQIEAANDSIARIGAGLDLVQDRFAVSLAAPVKVFADELFKAGTESATLQAKIDTLTRSALQGLSDLSGGAATVLSVLNGREEIAEFGVIGFLLFGKKGLLVGAALGAVYKDLQNIAATAFETFLGPSDAEGLLTEKIANLEFALVQLKRGARTPEKNELINAYTEQAIVARDELVSLQNVAARLPEGLNESEGVLETLTDLMRKLQEASSSAADAVGTVALSAGGGSIDTSDAGEQAPGDSIGGVGIDEAAPEQSEAEKLTEQEENLARIRESFFARELAARKRVIDVGLLYNAAGAKERAKILLSETAGALDTLGKHSKSFFKLSKIAGLANAAISIKQGIAAALALPPPASFAMAALVALNGAATIADLNATEFSGSQSITVPGGTTVEVGDATGGSAPDFLENSFEGTSEPGVQITVYAAPETSQEARDQTVADALFRLQKNGQIKPSAPIEVTHVNDTSPRGFV